MFISRKEKQKIHMALECLIRENAELHGKVDRLEAERAADILPRIEALEAEHEQYRAAVNAEELYQQGVANLMSYTAGLQQKVGITLEF